MNHLKLVTEAEMSRPLDLCTRTDFSVLNGALECVKEEKKKGVSLNVSQNLYYNRYSVEMFCEINTLYSRRRS